LRLEPPNSFDYFPYMRELRGVTIPRLAVAGGVVIALSLTALPDARAATGNAAAAPAAAGAVRGLDVSAYQHTKGPIDWLRIARMGFTFAGVKASEGTYYSNPYYRSDTRAAAAAGLAVLPYVFANPRRAGGRATASFAVGVTGNLHGPGQLPFVIDLENDPYKKADDCYGRRVPVMIKWIAGFLSQAHRMTGKWPIIYTTAAWWQQCTGSTMQFRQDPLWVAAFGAPAPAVPSPWHQWAFWQYANNGSLPGLGHVDLDYYRPTGDLPTLRAPAKPESKKPGSKPKKPRGKTKKPKSHPKKPRSHPRPAGKPKPKKPEPKKPEPKKPEPKPKKPRPGKPGQKWVPRPKP
jgi:GH25 family lysozyme M1 (1,4-beta-N-acetylmuramidase)